MKGKGGLRTYQIGGDARVKQLNAMWDPELDPELDPGPEKKNGGLVEKFNICIRLIDILILSYIC